MSLNDPRWGSNNQGNNGRGRKDDQGPPDLEEVWSELNRKLVVLLGGKRGGGFGRGGQPPVNFRQLGGGLWVLVGLLVIAWMFSGFYIVDANERGVVLRFGKMVETTEPGLRWRIPFPIERNEIVDLSGVRTVEIGYRGNDRNKILREALMLTDDANIINIQFAVQYILKNPEDYLFNSRHPDEAVTQAAETAMREIVGKNSMDFVLYEGREQVAASAHDSMQRILDRYGTGINISRVTMQNAQPPEQVQAAFDDAVKARQDRERQRNEGEAYANDIVPRAKGGAARLKEEADAYRARVVARSEGEAERFSKLYAEFSAAPKVTRERLYLETMETVLSSSSKILLDAKGGGNVTLLPLDKLMQGAAGAKGNNAPTTTNILPESLPATAEPLRQDNPAFNPRDRESLRNRGGR